MKTENDRLKHIITTYFNDNQTKFAEMIGVAQPIISNMVNKKQLKPNAEVVKKLEELEVTGMDGIYKINMSWFRTGDGDELTKIKDIEKKEGFFNDNINKRIEYLIGTIGKNKTTELAKKINYTPSALDSIVGERQSKPGYKLLYALIEKTWNWHGEAVKVSPTWLMTGLGEALIPKEQQKNYLTLIYNKKESYNLYDKIGDLENRIAEQDIMLDKINDILNYKEN